MVFYAHYDGQPVDAAQWVTKPWQPVLRDGPVELGGRVIPVPSTPGEVRGEWRLYGRSASDDKAPIEAILTAIDALHAAGIAPSVNLKLFFEGEEEAGVRGVTGVELTVYGPSHGLHSGHYGNWAPNPVTRLANLIASMRDDDGKILIKSYYNDVLPITATERRTIANIPAVDSAMRAETELTATEANDAPLVERIMLPALNLRGIRGGGVGSTASNTIPTEATASIDFRLVPKQTPEHVRDLVEAHLRSRGYFIVDHTPTAAERMAHPKVVKAVWEAGYPATRVAVDAPLSQAVIRATQDASDAPVVTLPTMGGSLPMYEFERVLHTPLIVLPIVNHDNNQHASNENLRLQNLFDGIEVYASVLASLGHYWK